MENNSVKTFSANGKLYAIPGDKVGQFQKDMPDAIPVYAFEKDGKKLGIPYEKVNDFLKDVPEAKPLYEYPELKDMFKSSQQPVQDYTQKPDTTRTIPVPAQTFQEEAEPAKQQGYTPTSFVTPKLESVDRTIAEANKDQNFIQRVFDNPEEEKISLARNMLRRSEDQVMAVTGQGGTGAGDALKDRNFWTLGASDMASIIYLKKIANKLEKGEDLSDADKTLLDAWATNKEVQQRYPLKDASRGYEVGKQVTDMVPWLVQFAGTGGIGAGARKGIEGTLMKGAQKYLGKTLGKVVSKGLGEVGGAYAQAAVMPNTGSDILQRTLGDTQRDDEGNVTFDKSTADSTPEAVYKGWTNSMLEVLTERMGEGATKALAPVLSKLPKTNIAGKLFGKAGEKAAETFTNFAQKVGWNGVPMEFAEEYVNIPLNAMLVGDSKYSDMFDGDQQLTTFLTVLTMGSAMTGLNAGMVAAGRVKDRNDVERDSRAAYGLARETFDKDSFSKLTGIVENKQLSLEDQGKQLHEYISQLPEDQAAVALNYAVAKIRQEQYDLSDREVSKFEKDLNRKVEEEKRSWTEIYNKHVAENNEHGKEYAKSKLDLLNSDPYGFFLDRLRYADEELEKKDIPDWHREEMNSDAEYLDNLLGKFDKYNARKRAEQAIEQTKNGQQQPASTPEQPVQPTSANPITPSADPMQQVKTEAEQDFDRHIHKESGNNIFVNHAKLGPIRLSMADIDQAGNITSETGEVFAWDPNSPGNQIPIPLNEIIGKPVIVSRDQYLNDANMKAQTAQSEEVAVKSNSYTDETGQRWMITGQQDEKGNPLVAMVDGNNRPTAQIKPVTQDQLDAYMQKKQVEEQPVPEGEQKPAVKTATWGKTQYQYKGNPDGTTDVLIPNKVPAAKAFDEISKHFANNTRFTVVPVKEKKLITDPNDEFADPVEQEVTTGVKIVPKEMAPATPDQAQPEGKGAKTTAQPQQKQVQASYSFGKDKIDRDEAVEIVNLAENYEDIKDLKLEGDAELDNLVKTKFPPAYTIAGQPATPAIVKANIRLGKNLDQISVQNDSELSNLLSEAQKKFTGSVNKNQNKSGNVPQNKPVTPSQPTSPIIPGEQKSPINESTPEGQSEINGIGGQFVREDYPYLNDLEFEKLIDTANPEAAAPVLQKVNTVNAAAQRQHKSGVSVKDYIDNLYSEGYRLRGMQFISEGKNPVELSNNKIEKDYALLTESLQPTIETPISEAILPQNPNEEREFGYKIDKGIRYDRKKPIDNKVEGNETNLEFSNNSKAPAGKWTVIEASEVQPSHVGKLRNPFHFIAEAQPKERTDTVSDVASEIIADKLSPEKITNKTTNAFYGAPTVNTRGEVIQGNNRSVSLQKYWNKYPSDPRGYKQYLIDHAQEMGLDPERIAAMKTPVLVNMVDISDDQAISFGQYKESDLTTGGIQRISASETARKLKDKLGNFITMLTNSVDDTMSLRDTIAYNALSALKYLHSIKAINDTQYQSALNKNIVTGDAIRDLQDVMTFSIFEGGRADLNDLFELLPYNLKIGIIKSTPNIMKEGGLKEEIQRMIIAHQYFVNSPWKDSGAKAVPAWSKNVDMLNPVTPEAEFGKVVVSLLHRLLSAKTQREVLLFFNEYDLLTNGGQGLIPEPAIGRVKAIEKLLNVPENEQGRVFAKLRTDSNETPSDVRGNELAPGQSPDKGSGTPIQGAGEENAAGKEPGEVTPQAQQPAPVSNPSDIAAKKADIERRRQEELGDSDTVLLASKIGLIEDYLNNPDTELGYGMGISPGGAVLGLGKGLVGIRGTYVRLNKDEWKEYRRIDAELNAEIITKSEARERKKELSKRVLNRGLSENQRVESPSELNDSDNINAKYDAELAAISSSQQVDQEAEKVNQNPSHAQKEAGNYQKGHVTIQGMDISIENPAGSKRRGTDPDGNKWESTMTAHYGYFKRTNGKDGDQIDTFINPDNPESDVVFVVDQDKPGKDEFDESKVMLGYKSYQEAKEAYLSNYEDGWVNNVRAITEVPLDKFKRWLYDGARQRKPFSEYKDTPAPVVEPKSEIGKPIIFKDLDASVEVKEITNPRNEMYKLGYRYEGTVSYPESLGEMGNYDEGYYHKELPTQQQLKEDVLQALENEVVLADETGNKGNGIIALSSREENILKAIYNVAPQLFDKYPDLVKEIGIKPAPVQEQQAQEKKNPYSKTLSSYANGLISLEEAKDYTNTALAGLTSGRGFNQSYEDYLAQNPQAKKRNDDLETIKAFLATNPTREQVQEYIGEKPQQKPEVVTPLEAAVENPIYKKAKEDFDRMMAGSKPEDIEGAKNGVGLSAARFANRYTTPEKNQELYNRIYDLYFSGVKNYKSPVVKKNLTTEKELWEMTRDEFIQEKELKQAESNKLDTPTENIYKVGDRYIEFGNDPYVFELRNVNPNDIDYSEKWQSDEAVLGRDDVQQYIKWFKEGKQPMPISVVFNKDRKEYISSNRRRLLAARNSGVKTIPAWVEVGKHRDLIQQALSEGKPVPENILKDYPELKKQEPDIDNAIKVAKSQNEINWDNKPEQEPAKPEADENNVFDEDHVSRNLDDYKNEPEKEKALKFIKSNLFDAIGERDLLGSTPERVKRIANLTELIKRIEGLRESPKEYRYKMLLRPFGISTHPKEGFVKADQDPEGGFQILTYDRKLDRKQWNQFSLLPITEIGEIKGKGFKDKDGEYTVTLKWENNNQWAEVTMQDKNGDLVSDPYDMSYMDILENIETGYWVENKKSDNFVQNGNNGLPERLSQGERRAQDEEGGELAKESGSRIRGLQATIRDARKDSEGLSDREITDKVEKAITKYAKENGIWFSLNKVSDLGSPFPSGNESEVFYNEKDGFVYKVNNLTNTGSVQRLIDAITEHNKYFPETSYEIHGFTGTEGKTLFPILKQRYINSNTVATPDEIGDYMKSLGFEKTGNGKYSNGEVTISDLFPRNVLKDASGDVFVIDNIIKSEPKEKPQRFDEGKKLTEEEKREVYRTLKDAYKVNNRPRTLEDQGQGERWMWLENASDYMVTSDITGAKLRWFVTLPDGKIAHPTELWPSMDRAEIERVQDSIERQGYYADKKYNETLTELKKNREVESVWDNIDRALKAGAEFVKEYSAEDRGQRNPNVYLRWKHLPGNTSIPDYHLRLEGSTFAGMNQAQYINAKETGNKWTRWENADIDWERFYNENKPLQTPLEKAISQNPVLKLESPESIEKLEDFGDKIGGARKDMGITRTVRDEESLPAWRRKYYFIPTEGKIGPEGKIDTTKPFFVVYDVKDSYNRKFPRKITSVGKYEPRVFTSEEEAEAYIPIFEVGQQRFRIRKGEAGFKIVRVSSTKKLVEYATFPTEEEANAYMYSTEGATSLLNHRREDFSIPKLDKVERNGKDWRKGKDVTTDEFMNTFGFRGGEFGNWVKPEERRVMLNAAYDSFMDLSELLNIPPRAVSLGGELAIAFGARGIKGAAAHFEPDRAVINMTRMNGAGSLAHEWAHAMDSYFGMQEAKSSYEKNEKGQLVNGGKFLSEDKTYKAGMRKELSKIFDEIVSATQSKSVTRVMGVEEKQKLFDLNSKLVNEESNHIIKKFEKGIIRYLYNRKTKQREETLVKATPEQLEKVKEVVDKIRNGEGTAPDWNRIPGSKGIGEYSYISPETLALEELHKDVFGKSGLKRDGNGFFNLGYYANKMYPAKKAFEKAKAGETETVNVKTDYLKNSIEFDASRSGPYFQKKVEMFARAFEYFIEQKLLDKNQRADYLQYDKAPVYEAIYGMSPYPAGEERAELNKLFQKFFDEVKVVDKGGVSFMQRVVSTIGYYSTVEDALDKITQGKGTPEQFKAMLLKNGAKQAEMGWMDFDGSFADKKSVTKADIQEWIDQNKIEVQEVVNDDSAPNNKLNELERKHDLAKTRLDQIAEKLGGRPYFSGSPLRWVYKSDGELKYVPQLYVDEINRLNEDIIAYEDAVDTDEYFDKTVGKTRYSQYTLPGGENYKELLLTMPDIQKQNRLDYNGRFIELQKEVLQRLGDKVKYPAAFNLYDAKHDGLLTQEELSRLNSIDQQANKKLPENFKSSHFDEPNILAHVRFDERVTPDGEKVLFIQEIQSDWAQHGKRKGFKSNEELLPDQVLINKAFSAIREMDNLGFNSQYEAASAIVEDANFDKTFDIDKEYIDDLKKWREYQVLKAKEKNAVPDMPFKNTEQWVNLSLRRMIRYAAEHGFDRIAWTTGEQQAERYDLSKQVDAIRYDKGSNGTYEIRADKNGREVLRRNGVGENELEEIVGKDIAQKIINGEGKEPSQGNYHKVLSGVDLKVGGEGMKAFYDKIIPSAASKLGKPFGAKLEPVTITGSASYEELVKAGEQTGLTQEELDKLPIDERVKLVNSKLPTVQSIPVTESMKETAMNGVPLFSVVNHKKQQFEVIQSANPAQDDIHTWIRDINEIQTLEEAIKSPEWNSYEEYNPDWTAKNANKAIRTGKVTVYSSKPIEAGTFVTPSKMEAQSYSGDGKVYSQEVNTNDVAWIDPTQGQYAPAPETFVRVDDMETIRGAIQNLQDKATNAKPLFMYSSDTELNQHLDKAGIPQDAAKKVLKDGKTIGFYDEGRGVVFIDLRKVGSVNEGIATWVHEMGIHAGLRNIIPAEQFDSFMEEVYDLFKNNNKTFNEKTADNASRTAKKAWDVVMKSKSYKNVNKAKKGEEMMAYFGERYTLSTKRNDTNLEDKGIFRQIVEKITNLLRKVFGLTKRELTLDDVELIVKGSIRSMFATGTRPVDAINQAPSMGKLRPDGKTEYQISNETEYPLSEKEFYKKYKGQHKDIRSKGNSLRDVQQTGFKSGAWVLPIYKGGKPTNIVEKTYGPKKGDFIYIVPKEWVKDTPGGWRVKEGWKPQDNELVEIAYDNQPIYEAYTGKHNGTPDDFTPLERAINKAVETKNTGNNGNFYPDDFNILRRTTQEGEKQLSLVDEPKTLPDGEGETYTTKKGEKIRYRSLSPDNWPVSGKIREKKDYIPGDDDIFCAIEREITESKIVELTGTDKIESPADVAYLFRHLESAASENAFVVHHLKGGGYVVQYISSGSTSGTVVDSKLIVAAAKEFGSAAINFVHNHPSGNLQASDADKKMHAMIRKACEGVCEMNPSVIIDLDRGEYGVFEEYWNVSEKTENDRKTASVKVPVYSFDKQVLYEKSDTWTQITGSDSVAKYLSKIKRGTGKYIVIIMNRNNRITRTFLSTTFPRKEDIIPMVGKHGDSVIIASPIKESDRVMSLSKSMEDTGVKLIDWIEIESDPGIIKSYKSAADEGLIRDPNTVYGYQPTEFEVNDPTPPIVTPLENVVQNAADRYAENRAIKRTWNEVRDQMVQFWKDVELPIKRLQESIVSLGGKLTDNSQPYRAIDLAKGRLEHLFKRYIDKKFKPLLKAVSDIRKMGISGADILPYMISKHALERNPDLRNKELNELVDKFKRSNPDATLDEIDVFTYDIVQTLQDKDYSGVMPFDQDGKGDSINGFTNPEELAQAIVDEFEARFDTPEKKALLKSLWDANHEAGQETLKIWKESNSMSEEEYQEQSARYNNFVPLRGWREGPAKDLRYHKGQGFGKSLQHADGRTSLAENPLAYMESVAFKAISEQVDNEVRREMLNLLLDNWKVKGVQKLVRQKQAYYIKVYDAMGNWEWDIARDPVTDELIKPDQSLIDSGEAKVKVYSNHEKLRTSAQAREHEVWVRTANMDVVLVFDSKNKDMLEVAHAFNHSNTMFKYMFSKNVGDANNWNKPLSATIGILNNWQKGMYTSFNVVFPFTNFGRDVQEGTLTQWIKGESGAKVLKNYKNAFPAIVRGIQGKTDPANNKYDELYERFYMTGGPTGYTHSKDIQQIERELEKTIKDLTNKGTIKGTVGRNARHLIRNVETWNRLFEDATRFSIFMSAVESGKTDKEAASMAKEATVNFNRKGKITKAFDSVWAFFNVSLESMFKNFGLARKYPARFAMVAGGYAAAGFFVTLMNDMLPGDDDDDYYNVSDYARRNYLIIPNIARLLVKGEKGDKYLRLPLPQFWRGFYSAGSLLYDVAVNKKETPLKAAGIGLSNFMAGLLPVDVTGVFSEEGVSFSPIAPTVTKPVVEMLENRNFMNQKIYNEPFTLAQQDRLANAGLGKSNVNQAIKFFTDLAFIAGGGEKETYLKKKVDGEGMSTVSWWADLNPSKIEHILKGYSGGTGGVITDAVTTAIQFADPNTPTDFRNMPFINAFIRKVPEAKWGTIREYQKIKSYISDYPVILSAYRKDARLSGNTGKYVNAYRNPFLQEYLQTIKVYDNVISNLAERVDYKTGEGMDEMVKVMNDAINKVNAIKDKYDK